MEYVIALDQGTTGSTAAIFTAGNLKLLASNKVEFEQYFPKPGWVEHDAKQIWSSMCEALKNILQESKIDPAKIVCLGVTNQRETVVAWDRNSGELLARAIVWQDRRTADYCANLRADQKLAEMLATRTGLICDPYFSASKMRWLLKESQSVANAARDSKLALATVDSYLIWRLTQGASFVTDHTNASRTMLYDLARAEFSSELADIFEVPLICLPEIKNSTEILGYTKQVPGLPDGIPISGCLGDQQAALYGHNITAAGQGKITYGTGAFLLLSLGKQLSLGRKGLLTTVANSDKSGRTFALEGSAFIAGAAVQYLRDQFQWFKDAKESEIIALSGERDPSVMFVPALAGLGAPYWNANARGVLFGLSRGSGKAQVTRAVLESIALQNVQILNLMRECAGIPIAQLGVDGGAARSNYLMQFQADCAQVKLVRPTVLDITAKGAARAALKGIGRELNTDQSEIDCQFSAQMSAQDANKIVSEWVRAAECVNGFYAG